MNKKRFIFVYLFFDIVAAICTWMLFFVYRKYNVDVHLFEQNFSVSVLNDIKFYIGLFAFPLYWLVLHTFTGIYKNDRRSRLKELETTFVVTLIGVLIFFFAFILDDIVNDYSDYWKYFLLFPYNLFLPISRLIITSIINRKIKQGKSV